MFSNSVLTVTGKSDFQFSKFYNINRALAPNVPGSKHETMIRINQNKFQVALYSCCLVLHSCCLVLYLCCSVLHSCCLVLCRVVLMLSCVVLVLYLCCLVLCRVVLVLSCVVSCCLVLCRVATRVAFQTRLFHIYTNYVFKVKQFNSKILMQCNTKDLNC